jgi:glycosyltransferase involved in cell wall biosynthesis
MGALDVLVHPAVGTDAFPLVVLEALASGKPVVASRLDGIPEEIDDGRHGLLVPPGDVPALADAMRTLLGDAALRQRLGAAGRERVCQRFSRARLAREVRELYCRLCAPK